MATIKPFAAVRPSMGREKEIAALPYDVYNTEEAKAEINKHNNSFLKIDRPETQFDREIDIYDPLVYEKANSIYINMKNNKLLIKDEIPYFYIYELTMNARIQTGIVACASCDEYENNIVKKHENTRSDKERDRINHVKALNAQTGPIFLTYRNNAEISEFIEKFKINTNPYMDFVSDDKIKHRGWIISKEEDIEWLINNFNLIDYLYVADGHHRLASAAKVSHIKNNSESNYFLSVIFPDNELMIMDYNRVVKDLNNLTENEFLEKISDNFIVKEIPVTNQKPLNKGDIYMFLGQKEYCINLKKEFESDDPIECLDVSVLQKYILAPVLGIDNPKTDTRIDFIGGIRGIDELFMRLNTDSKIAFAMYPTQMNELFNVADNNLLMPPKSTWFEPKLRSGLFIHEI